MSRLWPHTPYAEDQPYSHPILYTHVLTRAIQTGSLLGAFIGADLLVLRYFRLVKPAAVSSTITSSLLRSTGIGALVGTGILAIGLPLRMHSQEEIQWKDRSWRLLENKGQVECDDWTYGGMAAGAAVAALKGRALGWRGAVGLAGVGSLGGMMGYMAWRYGVKGGKWDEKEL